MPFLGEMRKCLHYCSVSGPGREYGAAQMRRLSAFWYALSTCAVPRPACCRSTRLECTFSKSKPVSRICAITAASKIDPKSLRTIHEIFGSDNNSPTTWSYIAHTCLSFSLVLSDILSTHRILLPQMGVVVPNPYIPRTRDGCIGIVAQYGDACILHTETCIDLFKGWGVELGAT
jgi:hypothetical protein